MYPRDFSDSIPESAMLSGKLEPTNEGYALGKIVIAKLCEYISKENANLNYKTLVPCNIFGRYDKFCPDKSHLVPAVIQKLHLAKKNNLKSIEIWGDGKARREFMFADDLAECIWKCVKDFESVPSLMNIGQGEDHPIKTYYEVISDIVGYDGDFDYDLSKPVGMKRKLVDSSKCQQWGWRPKHTLQQGVQLTYDYYLEEISNE